MCIQCRSRWGGGSLWATWSRPTLFALLSLNSPLIYILHLTIFENLQMKILLSALVVEGRFLEFRMYHNFAKAADLWQYQCKICPFFDKLQLPQAAKTELQSTLVISKSKGPSKTLRDICTSTYQICRIEENTNRTTKFHKCLCNLTPLVRNIYWKYRGKGEKLLPRSNFSPFSTIFCNLILDFYAKTRTRFSLRDKRLFEITEVEITRVDCIWHS